MRGRKQVLDERWCWDDGMLFSETARILSWRRIVNGGEQLDRWCKNQSKRLPRVICTWERPQVVFRSIIQQQSALSNQLCYEQWGTRDVWGGRGGKHKKGTTWMWWSTSVQRGYWKGTLEGTWAVFFIAKYPTVVTFTSAAAQWWTTRTRDAKIALFQIKSMKTSTLYDTKVTNYSTSSFLNPEGHPRGHFDICSCTTRALYHVSSIIIYTRPSPHILGYTWSRLVF